MDPYQALTNAIIEQAVKDYRKALKIYYLHLQKQQYRQDVEDLERFFTSQWFELLTNLDGRSIMTRVRRMVKMEVAA